MRSSLPRARTHCSRASCLSVTPALSRWPGVGSASCYASGGPASQPALVLVGYLVATGTATMLVMSAAATDLAAKSTAAALTVIGASLLGEK